MYFFYICFNNKTKKTTRQSMDVYNVKNIK